MSAPAFDPWAALARIEREAGSEALPPDPSPTPAISRISGISRGASCETEIPRAPDAMAHDDAEAVAMAAHYAAEGEAQPYQPGDPDPLRDGLLASALQRPPAWSDPSLIPPPGAWCSCCGRFDRKGGRWWTTAPEPDGWACVTCHPPDHLPTDAVRVMQT